MMLTWRQMPTGDHPITDVTESDRTMPIDGYEYVRGHYGVDAREGRRVEVDGHGGVLVRGTGDQYLQVRFDHSGMTAPCHPTWRVNYLRPPYVNPDAS